MVGLMVERMVAWMVDTMAVLMGIEKDVLMVVTLVSSMADKMVD